MRIISFAVLFSIYTITFGVGNVMGSNSEDSSYEDDNFQNFSKSVTIVKSDVKRKRKKELIENFEKENLSNESIDPQRKSKRVYVLRSKTEIEEENEFFLQKINTFFEQNQNKEMQLSSELSKLMSSVIDEKKRKAKKIAFRKFLTKLTDEKNVLYDPRYVMEKRKNRLYLKFKNNTENESSLNNSVNFIDVNNNLNQNLAEETEEENEMLDSNENEIKEIISDIISSETSNDNNNNNNNMTKTSSDFIQPILIEPNHIHIPQYTLRDITEKLSQTWKLKKENDKIGQELIERYNFTLKNIYSILNGSNIDINSLNKLQNNLDILEKLLPNHFDKIEKKAERIIQIDLTEEE